MRRHLPQPHHPGILHRRICVQAFGDGVGNGGLALFGQQSDEFFLLGNQPVNLRRFAVEEGGDGGLFMLGWKRCGLIEIAVLVEILNSRGLIY